MSLTVVNRHRDEDIEATIDLGAAAISGPVSIAEVNGPSVEAANSFESPRTVDTRERRAELHGPRPVHRFPAHSISVLRFEVRGA